MASINGICVKGLKEFKGHEGEPLCQGNLYLNNKKIGFWSQDAWGGPDNVQLESGYNEKLLNEAVHSLNVDKDYHGSRPDGSTFVVEYNLERLMADYIPLYEDEKIYKQAEKKGYKGVVIASDGYHQVSWALPGSYMQKKDAELLKVLEADIKEAKRSFFKEDQFTQHSVKIYRSLDDFVIGEPIKMDNIIQKPKLQDAIDSCKTASKQQSVSEINKSSEREER